KVMENIASNEDWKGCFCKFAQGLLFFAGRWLHSEAEAKDMVQKVFVKFWRRITRLITARCFIPRCVRSLLTLFVVTAGARGVRRVCLAKLNSASRNLKLRMKHSELWRRQSVACRANNVRCWS